MSFFYSNWALFAVAEIAKFSLKYRYRVCSKDNYVEAPIVDLLKKYLPNL
jgi:hypothetical protein